MSEPQRDPIVVEQSSTNVNVLWGFLSVAFAVALWRGHQGAQTNTGRLVLDIVFSAGVIVSAAAWISSHRHPARLEVSQDAVSLFHRGKPNSVELRRTGPLYVRRIISPRGGARSYLMVVGSDNAIPLVLFNWKSVERACRAAGWAITRPPSLRGRRKDSPG